MFNSRIGFTISLSPVINGYNYLALPMHTMHYINGLIVWFLEVGRFSYIGSIEINFLNE